MCVTCVMCVCMFRCTVIVCVLRVIGVCLCVSDLCSMHHIAAGRLIKISEKWSATGISWFAFSRKPQSWNKISENLSSDWDLLIALLAFLRKPQSRFTHLGSDFSLLCHTSLSSNLLVPQIILFLKSFCSSMFLLSLCWLIVFYSKTVDNVQSIISFFIEDKTNKPNQLNSAQLSSAL